MMLHRCRRIVLCLALAALSLLSLFAWSFVTDAAASTLFAGVSGSGSTCSQALPCQLSTALVQAGVGDTIYVAQGTYTSTDSDVVNITQTLSLYGGWNGVATGAPVRDAALYPTKLDGENARRVVNISGDIAPTIDGFIIARGNASNTSSGTMQGGGIRSFNADPIIQNNIITGNVAYTGTDFSGQGGGIYLYRAAASALISGNQILSNTASPITSGLGGGLMIDQSDAVIRNNRIEGNVTGFYGGGVYLWYNSPQLFGNEIRSNRAGRNAGGVYIGGYPASPVIQGNLIIGNSTGIGWHGGGMMVSGNISATISANRILSNTASDSGGIGLETDQYFTVTNNVIAHNSGGGIQVWDLTRYGLIAHNTIVANTGSGGGIYLTYDYVTPTIVNNIVVSNSAGIIASTFASGTLDYNLVWGNIGSNYILPGALEPGAHDVGSNPMFVDAAHDDYHLKTGSPAIDVALNVGVTRDADGDARPLGAGYDIGADEFRTTWIVYLPVLLR